MISKPFRIGVIARMDASGLGNQTRELVRMLNPHKILAIDSDKFRPGFTQHPEWYKDYTNVRIVKGFPNETDFLWLLEHMDAVITAETPYRYRLFAMAKQRGVKTFLQYNYEFFEYFQRPNAPMPTKLLAPARWNMDKVAAHSKVQPILLRPPLRIADFEEVRKVNMLRSGKKKRFLHVVGKQAAHDRNGTESIIRMLPHTDADFEIVFKSQDPLPYVTNDPRVTFDYSSPVDNAELYRDFDALIMPRKYGGLCLPMNEALASGLPVIMTNVEPNNDLLKPEWLVDAIVKDTFMARTRIDIHEANVIKLIETVNRFIALTPEQLLAEKLEAANIAYEEFSYDKLRPKYLEVFREGTSSW